MSESINHIERYQLKTLSTLLDEFEEYMETNVASWLKSNDDYQNILFFTAGKSSLTLRALIHLCASGFPDAALMLARQIYEQSIILSFFEEIRKQPDFDNYVEDYFADYELQKAKYYKLWAENKETKDPEEIARYQKQISTIYQQAHSNVNGEYWWTGRPGFANVVDFLKRASNDKVARYMGTMYLLYKRACKDVHAGSLGNMLRLGSDPDMCGVDNSAKVSGHGLPLYFAVSSFVVITIISFGNFNINCGDLIKKLDRLLDLYAAIDHDETTK